MYKYFGSTLSLYCNIFTDLYLSLTDCLANFLIGCCELIFRTLVTITHHESSSQPASFLRILRHCSVAAFFLLFSLVAFGVRSYSIRGSISSSHPSSPIHSPYSGVQTSKLWCKKKKKLVQNMRKQWCTAKEKNESREFNDHVGAEPRHRRKNRPGQRYRAGRNKETCHITLKLNPDLPEGEPMWGPTIPYDTMFI